MMVKPIRIDAHPDLIGQLTRIGDRALSHLREIDMDGRPAPIPPAQPHRDPVVAPLENERLGNGDSVRPGQGLSRTTGS